MKLTGGMILLILLSGFITKAQVPDFPGMKDFQFTDSIVFESNAFHNGIPAPGIYRLSPDHMPCLVPDTRSIAPIPNFRTGNSMALKNAPGILSPSRTITIQFTAFPLNFYTKPVMKNP